MISTVKIGSWSSEYGLRDSLRTLTVKINNYAGVGTRELKCTEHLLYQVLGYTGKSDKGCSPPRIHSAALAGLLSG